MERALGDVDGPRLGARVLAGREDGALVDPGDLVDTSAVGEGDLDLGARVLGVPDVDVLVETATGDETAIGGPGHRVDDGAVELPAVELELTADRVPDVDGAVLASRGKLSSVGGEAEGGHSTRVSGELLGLSEASSSNVVEVDGGILLLAPQTRSSQKSKKRVSLMVIIFFLFWI